VKKNGAMRIGCSASLCLSFLVLGQAQLEAEQKKSAQPGISFLVLGRAQLEAELFSLGPCPTGSRAKK